MEPKLISDHMETKFGNKEIRIEDFVPSPFYYFFIFYYKSRLVPLFQNEVLKIKYSVGRNIRM
jgi:hypothetical protein